MGSQVANASLSCVCITAEIKSLEKSIRKLDCCITCSELTTEIGGFCCQRQSYDVLSIVHTPERFTGSLSIALMTSCLASDGSMVFIVAVLLCSPSSLQCLLTVEPLKNVQVVSTQYPLDSNIMRPHLNSVLG